MLGRQNSRWGDNAGTPGQQSPEQQMGDNAGTLGQQTPGQWHLH